MSNQLREPNLRKDKVARAEFVDGGEDGGPARLLAVRKIKWGTSVMIEKPIVRVSRPEEYLDAKDADPRLRKLAEDLEDFDGLAAYIAFQQIHEKKQKEFLALGSPEVYEKCAELTEKVDMFLQKRPEYKRWLNWDVYKQILAVMAHRSIRCPDGSRCLYEKMSKIRHSWRPNCVWQTNTERYPLGEKELLVVATDGVNKGQELTVSYVAETSILKPREVGLADLVKEMGPTCSMRCVEEDDAQGEDQDMIHCVVEVLVDALAADPPTREALQTAQEALKDFDKALPFSMVFKARARQKVCQMVQLLNARESSQNITKTEEARKQRESQLKEMLELQAQAIKELDVILGAAAQDSIQKIVEEGYKPIEDESEFLQKHVKEREAKKVAQWQGFYGQALNGDK